MTGSLMRFPGTRAARDRYLSELRSIYGSHIEIPDPDYALLSDPEIYVKMERDPVIYTALDYRVKSVIAQGWHLEPASDEQIDKDAAAIFEELLYGIRKFQQSRAVLFKAALLMARGYAWVRGRRHKTSSLGGRTVRGAWLPSEIDDEDKRRFRYVPVHGERSNNGKRRTTQKLQFRAGLTEQEWVDLRPAERRALISMTYEDRADRLGMGQGVGVPLYHWFRQKGLAWRDWAQASERWAQGIIAMKMNETRKGSKTNEELADEALDEIDEMRSRHAFVYGEGEEVKVFETSGRGQQISEDQIKKIDEDIIRLLTGSVRPMGGDSDTGARAQAQTEQETTDVMIRYDQSQLDETMTESVVRCVWELNTPLLHQLGLHGAKMPRFATAEDRRQDPTKAVAVIAQALQAQIPLRKADVYDVLGFQAPAEDDEVFEGAPPAPGGVPGGSPFDAEQAGFFSAMERIAGLPPCERDAELAMYAKKPARCPDGTIMPKSGDCTGHGAAEEEEPSEKDVGGEVNHDPVYSRQDGDCGITALSRIADIPYETADRILIREGWKAGEGVKIAPFLAGAEEAGMEWDVAVPPAGAEIGNVIEGLDDDGRYAIVAPDHVISFVKGQEQNLRGYYGDDAKLQITFTEGEPKKNVRQSRDRTGGSEGPASSSPAATDKENE